MPVKLKLQDSNPYGFSIASDVDELNGRWRIVGSKTGYAPGMIILKNGAGDDIPVMSLERKPCGFVGDWWPIGAPDTFTPRFEPTIPKLIRTQESF